MKKLEEAKKYWSNLGNIPVNENDEIDEEFDGFPIGTDKIEIWSYIEEYFNVSIYEELMFKEI